MALKIYAFAGKVEA